MPLKPACTGLGVPGSLPKFRPKSTANSGAADAVDEIMQVAKTAANVTNAQIVFISRAPVVLMCVN